jgi:hypothetical protein
LSQKALILSRVFDCLTSTNNHFHTFAYLPQSPLSTTLHINDSNNMVRDRVWAKHTSSGSANLYELANLYRYFV